MEWRAEEVQLQWDEPGLRPDSLGFKFRFITFSICFLWLCHQLTQAKQFEVIPVYYFLDSIGQRSRHS